MPAFGRARAALTVDDFLRKAVELEFARVALVAKRPHVSPLDYSTTHGGNCGQAPDHGLELAAMMGYSDFTAGLENPGIPSAEMNAAYIGVLAGLASDLGTSRLRIFTGYYKSSSDMTRSTVSS